MKWNIAIIPLGMLALSAAYGVYSFSLLFVPIWVSLITALAFELTYIFLAVSNSPRAKYISIGAVITSIIWNFFHSLYVIHPSTLVTMQESIVFSIILATLHSVPLATLAYLVADVTIHSTMGSGDTEKGITKKSTMDSVDTGKRTGYNESLPRNRQIQLDREQGMTYNELAEKYQLSISRLKQIVKGG